MKLLSIACLLSVLVFAQHGPKQPNEHFNSQSQTQSQPTGNAGPGGCSGGIGQVMYLLANGKAGCDGNLSYDPSGTQGLMANPILRVGTVSSDPLGYGTPANVSVVDNIGLSAWIQHVSGGNNWFAEQFASSGGTAQVPITTGANAIVGQIDGVAYTGKRWAQATSMNMTSLGMGDDETPIGQFVFWAYNHGFKEASLVALDGSYKRFLIGANIAIGRSPTNCQIAAADGPPPEIGIFHICMVPGSLPHTGNLVLEGHDGIQHVILSNVPGFD